MISTILAQARQPAAILVPLDGSELAEQALAVAAAHARRTGAALHLVSVHEPLPALALPPDVPLPMDDLDDQAIAGLQQYVTSVGEKARATLRSPVVTTVLADKSAAEALADYAGAHAIDLVVMTTHGRTGLSRLWLGSVADRLLRRLHVPVLLLHPNEVQPTEFRHFVVALDGEIEEPVFEALVALGARPGTARCILTRVVEPTLPVLSGLATRPGHLPPDWTAKRVIDARNYLSRIADPMVRAGWDVDWQVVTGRGVAGEILALAKASAADCIVVGTHGSRGMERLLLGSVADKVVRGADIPVLVAPVGHLTVTAGSEGVASARLQPVFTSPGR
jgi:nucleotide-binding universal stress UspA family protein